MPAKDVKWFKIAESLNELQWQQNMLLVTEAGGKKITLARIGKKVYACAYKCPHAGGILADGHVDFIGNIVCPLHRYKFNLSNGYNGSGEGYYLKTYPLEEREEGIFVGLEDSSWIDFFK